MDPTSPKLLAIGALPPSFLDHVIAPVAVVRRIRAADAIKCDRHGSGEKKRGGSCITKGVNDEYYSVAVRST